MGGAGQSQIEPCSNCGAEDWQVEEFGAFARLSLWLQSGRPAPRARLTCRSCGAGLLTHDNGSWGVLRSYRTLSGRWGAPIRVLRALVYARTAIPAPWIYLAAAAAGTLLGIALNVTIGWPWWAVALASVAAVWILFLLTAFTGAGRRQSLWANILDALDPKGALARWSRREEEAFRAAPFALYGLPPSWEGSRFLGQWGWGGMGKEVGPTELELAHGDPEDPAGLEFRVSSSLSRREPELPREFVLRQLAEGLWQKQNRPPTGLPPERLHDWVRAREQESRRRDIPPFTPVQIPVDGEPVRFDHHSEGPAWVAVGRTDDVSITLRARNLAVDAVELVRVTDIEPYVEGSRRLREQSRSEA